MDNNEIEKTMLEELSSNEDYTIAVNIEALLFTIEDAMTLLVKNKLSELDYDNEGEVALYAQNPDSVWNEEAKAMQTWIEQVYTKMYSLQEYVKNNNLQELDITNDINKLKEEFNTLYKE